MQNLVNWSDNCDGGCCHVELANSIVNHMVKLVETATGKIGFCLLGRFDDELLESSHGS